MNASGAKSVGQSLALETAARTEVGRRRHINQDAVALRPDLGLYILSDGMGGPPSGEVASAITVEAMQQFYLDAGATWPADADGPASDPRAFLVAAVKHANVRIRQQAELEPSHRGMGSAVAAVRVSGAGFCIAHVGHVRGYLLRDGFLSALTEDHTQISRDLYEGIPYDIAERRPGASSLSRALGVSGRVRVTAHLHDARPGDLVALVSNGLYNRVSDMQMGRYLGGEKALASIADDLIGVAQAHGASDDISCVLLRWLAEDAREPHLAA